MSQISGAANVDSVLNQPANRFSELSSEDFLQIIFTELTNQDPLQPNDTSALLEQLNSIRSIESDIQLSNQLQTLVTENQLASASNMLGKVVAGRTTNLDRATGFVVSVIKQGDDINLELDTGQLVPIQNVETVLDPSMFGTPPPPQSEPQTP